MKYVSNVAPGRFRAQLWAPAWTLLANLGKDLTEGPGTSTGAGRVISRPDDHCVIFVYHMKYDK